MTTKKPGVAKMGERPRLDLNTMTSTARGRYICSLFEQIARLKGGLPFGRCNHENQK